MAHPMLLIAITLKPDVINYVTLSMLTYFVSSEEAIMCHHNVSIFNAKLINV